MRNLVNLVNGDELDRTNSFLQTTVHPSLLASNSKLIIPHHSTRFSYQLCFTLRMSFSPLSFFASIQHRTATRFTVESHVNVPILWATVHLQKARKLPSMSTMVSELATLHLSSKASHHQKHKEAVAYLAAEASCSQVTTCPKHKTLSHSSSVSSNHAGMPRPNS